MVILARRTRWALQNGWYALAKTQGISGLRVAVVDGDDLRENIRGLQTQQWGEEKPLDLANTEILAANVYMGSQPIADALDQDPHVVVTGRVTDWPDARTLDAAFWLGRGRLGQNGGGCPRRSFAGMRVADSGGYHADPGRKNVPAWRRSDLDCRSGRGRQSGITKPVGSGGVVNTRTVKEQILYELDDPENYTGRHTRYYRCGSRADWPDRVRVSGAKGKPAPDTWKVTISVDGGWLGEGEISYAGPNALARAKLAAQTMRERIDVLGLDCDLRTDLIGTVSIHDGDTGELTQSYDGEPQEVRMRAAANAHDEATAALVAREVDALL